MSTRILTDHKVNGLNEALEIRVLDHPGQGGANHSYAILGFHPGQSPFAEALINFQNGPIKSPADMNGVTNETLLAVLIDRMRGFQYGRNPDGSFDENSRGKYACRDNAIALTHLEDALMRLQKRTRDRMARGVEGTNTP